MKTHLVFADLGGIATEVLVVLAGDAQTEKGAKPELLLLTANAAVKAAAAVALAFAIELQSGCVQVERVGDGLHLRAHLIVEADGLEQRERPEVSTGFCVRECSLEQMV